MRGKVSYLLIILILAVISRSMAGTDPTIEELLQSAQERYQQGRYYEAMNFYRKALTIDSTQSEAHYYLGECHRYLFQYELALEHFKKISPTSMADYPLLVVSLGLVHKSLGNYDQAALAFKSFQRSLPKKAIPDQEYWLNRVKSELASLSDLQSRPFTPQSNTQVTKLPPPVNSASHDLAAIPYWEKSMLIVSSSRQGAKGKLYHDQHGESFSDNYLFVQDAQQWYDSSSTHRFSTLNTAFDEGPGTITEDRQYYYFTRYTGEGDYHIFVSTFTNDRWKMARPLPTPINLPGYISKHPALSASGDTLFFSSNRPGGYGESDLWMSVRIHDEWQPPINLGPAINTPYHETSPHWNIARQLLFFASNGHAGWGGYDLFMASELADELPFRVINLDLPLNSSKDDTYIWVGENSGFITSNRDSTTGDFDIYQYQYHEEPKLLLSLTTQSFWDTWISRLHAEWSEDGSEEIQQFFSSLPSEEQQRLQQTVRSRIFKALQSEDRVSLAMQIESQQLLSSHRDKIQELVDSQLAFYLSFQLPTWSDETQKWYSSLPQEDKKRIASVAESLVLEALLQLNTNFSQETSFGYEELPSEQRHWVDQATDRGIRHFRETASELIGLEEMHQWQTLSSEEKEELQREMLYRYFLSVTLSEDSSTTLHHRFEQLPQQMQQQIDRMAYSLVFKERSSGRGGINEDILLLDTLSSEEQLALARLVAYRSETLRSENAFEANSGVYRWEELPNESKNTLQRVIRTRSFAERIVADFSPASESSQRSINLHSLLQANPDIVTIRGKVSTQSTDQAVSVSLGSRGKRLYTKTHKNGCFTFERVKYHQSQQLFLGDEETGMSEMLALYLEELEITVVQDSQFVEPFDHIYFETNEYQLDSEAYPVLDRIVDFHQHHPDITIQIHAYTDSVGSNSFNYRLSERRGESVYQALVQRGVHPEALVYIPQGKDSTGHDKLLSYSRRVEFKITGINTVYNPTRTIYLLAADPDMLKIAQRYNLGPEELQALNPGLSADPPPYSIIKIVTNPLRDEP